MIRAFAILICVLCGCQNNQLYKDNRVMMGTFVEVTSPYKEAPQIAFAEIKRIEGLLSKYNPESEISQLNRLGRLKVSPETFYIIKKSLEFWRLTDGAFDITVAPLLDLWGFTDKNYALPDQDKIKEALKLVGADKIILQEKDNVVELSLSGMKLDLGAIAKGFATDCAARKLKESGINSCLINAGGQVYALGNNFGRPWKVAIKNPRAKGFTGQLFLKDQAAATSGDYEQYFIRDGRRYAHIFNPKTGHPVDSDVISATVIAPDGLTADALSTAVFVLGKEPGVRLVSRFSGVRAQVFEQKDILK